MDTRKLGVSLILLCLLAVGVTAQECEPMPDRVEAMLNFNPQYTFPCMYSGYVQVDAQTDSNLFYWFFRDEAFDDDAPLILWLNGGPGASSQIGNLMENGPLRLVEGPTGDTEVHSLTGISWTAVGNMLYLDQPVGVGYSYGDLLYSSQEHVRKYTLEFLKGFYQKHPEMKGRDFWITGESYGGKYEPNIADAILEHNKNATEEEQIPLKGMLVGNGYVDPITQRLSMRHLSLALGTIQFDAIPQLDILEQRCEEATSQELLEAPKICADISKYIESLDGGMDIYDSRWPVTNSSSQENRVEEYLNNPIVVEQLHASASSKPVKFSIDNSTVYEFMLPDGMKDYISLYQKLLEADLPILLFVGNMDRKDGPYGVQEWMKKLEWAHMKDFHASSENVYYYPRDDNGEVIVGGNFKKYKNLNLLMIYSAGHLVPSTQLAISRIMLQDMVTGGELKCHAENEDDCNLDDVACEYMNHCNGHGECINGKCVNCVGDFFGADCSIFPQELSSNARIISPMAWEHYKISNTKDFVVEISGNSVVEIFAMEGEVPTRTTHSVYSKGKVAHFLLKATNQTNFVSIYNTHGTANANLQVNLAERQTSSSWMFWLCVGLGGAVAVLSTINLVMCIRRSKKKGVQYVGINDSS